MQRQPSATLGWTRRATDVKVPSTVSLVIPARNEARNLSLVLENLPGCVTEVILVDGSSSDVTKLMASTCRPDIRIITEPAPGKGHALRAGFEAAHSDVIIAMDADGSMLPSEIPQLLYFLDNGYDFVKGSRFVGSAIARSSWSPTGSSRPSSPTCATGTSAFAASTWTIST
jgi:glycosyltransferase involved in cell wall biosynthesis